MRSYSTVTEALNGLKDEGYVLDFNLKADCVECKTLDMQLYPADFGIDKFYRFEGASNPDDSAIVYAISSVSGLKGTLVDAYDAYVDSLTNEMIKKIKIKR
jgi:hypothetical protein